MKLTTLAAGFMKRHIFSALYETAEGGDVEALDENTAKHVRALLKCLFILPAAYVAIHFGGEKAGDIVFYVSLAAQVAGLAWFVISFAALPKRHLGAAMQITEAMFCSFLSGVFALLVLAGLQAPLSLFVIGPIYWWLYRAATMYDSADLLKAGKDEVEILAAQATQRIEVILQCWAKKNGITVDSKEGEGE